MIPFVAFSLRRAWQGFWRNALMSLAATLTMVLMLLLLAGFFVLQNVLLASLSFVEQKVEVVAYIQNNATPDQVDTLVASLGAMPEVASVEFVSRDEALTRFKAAQAAQGRPDITAVPRVEPAVRERQRQAPQPDRTSTPSRPPSTTTRSSATCSTSTPSSIACSR